MDAVRKIVETSSSQLTIDIPDEYRNRKLEVIVLAVDDVSQEHAKMIDLSKYFGKMEWQGDALEEQRRLRDEWD